MLGNQERDASLTDALCILGYHVVTHNLDVATVAFQQKVANKMGFRVKCNTMVDMWVLFKEVFQNRIVLFAFVIKRQVYLVYLHLREMVVHVVTKSCLTVLLLL